MTLVPSENLSSWGAKMFGDILKSIKRGLQPTWTSLGSLLGSSTSRVIYTLPLAGYVILYSDYFLSLFKFSSLTSGGFLTFSQRADLIYYGSLILLLAYGLWWVFSPRLLRGKRDLHQFVSDIVVARDRSTIIEIVRSAPYTPQESAIFAQSLTDEDRVDFQHISSEIMSRGRALGDGALEIRTPDPRFVVLRLRWAELAALS